jgi:trans-aconitate methyltransferase
MPYSANSFDNILVDHINNLNPTSVIDIGTGSGKNGSLLRATGYKNKLEGIEPTESYRTEFKLDTIYDKIYPYNIKQFMDIEFSFKYDVAIFGDVLEHLFRSEAIDTLDYFLYKCNWIIVVWPNNMPQDAYGNNPYEIHKSNFSLNDLTSRFDVQYYLKNFAYYNYNDPTLTDAFLNYTIIKGYLTPRKASIYDLKMWK